MMTVMATRTPKKQWFSTLPPLHDHDVKMPNLHILWRLKRAMTDFHFSFKT